MPEPFIMCSAAVIGGRRFFLSDGDRELFLETLGQGCGRGRLEAPEEVLVALRRGWRVGAEDFIDRLVSRVERPARTGHGRRVHEETEKAVGRRIVKEELRERGWKTAELEQRAKGDGVKVEIARRLRAETTLTLEEIADLVQMGAPTYVAFLLYHRA